MSTRWILILLGLVFLGGFVYYGFDLYPKVAPGHLESKQEENKNAYQSQLRRISANIRELAGDGGCDQDSQCRIVGLGASFCGKHKDFLVYSRRSARESTLLNAVAEFNEVHRKLKDQEDTSASCGVEPAEAKCVRHRCVAVER